MRYKNARKGGLYANKNEMGKEGKRIPIPFKGQPHPADSDLCFGSGKGYKSGNSSRTETMRSALLLEIRWRTAQILQLSRKQTEV